MVKSNIISVPFGNEFVLMLPVGSLSFQDGQPVEERIDASLLKEVTVKLNNRPWEAWEHRDGCIALTVPADTPVDTYNIDMTAVYENRKVALHHSEAFAIVRWNKDSHFRHALQGAPRMAPEALFITATKAKEPVLVTVASVYADSAVTVSAEVGSASVTNPSSQTANTSAVKLNDSGYIEIAPVGGAAAGQKCEVTVYNQASSAKVIGFRLASKTGKLSICEAEGHSYHTFDAVILREEDITEDGKVRIYRYSSDGWFHSARILKEE